MRASVLMIVIGLGVCSLKAEDPVQRVDDVTNQEQPMKVEGEESQRVREDQREDDKVLKTKTISAKDDTATKIIELELKKVKTNLTKIYKMQRVNGLIANRTSKSENDTKIQEKGDVKGSALDNTQGKGEKVLDDGSNVRDINLAEYYVESTSTAVVDSEAHDTTKFERRSDDDALYNDQENLQNKKAYLMPRGVYKIRRVTSMRHSPKKMQRRTFDFWSMLGMGEKKEDVVKIKQEVPVFVPYAVETKIPFPVTVHIERKIPIEVSKPYPVPIEKKVYYPVKEYVQAPYPVYKKVPYLVKVMIEKPVPVHISKMYPVYIEKKVPYAVEKEVPYPVKVPVDRPVPVHIPVVKNVYYPVEKKVPFPVPITVEKPVPVPVEKPYPVYIEKNVPETFNTHVPYPAPVEESNQQHLGTHDLFHEDITKEEFVPLEQEKTLNYEGHSLENQLNNENSFTHLGSNSELHDHSQPRDKNDAGDEQEILETKTEEKVEEAHLSSTTEQVTTTQLPPAKKDKKREGEDEKIQDKIDIRNFGKKIRKT